MGKKSLFKKKNDIFVDSGLLIIIRLKEISYNIKISSSTVNMFFLIIAEEGK